MKLRRLLIIIIGVALAAALLPAFMSVPDVAFAQISPLATPTYTPTPVPRGPTDTPVPPTPTDTPVPPTDTPPPPTNTPPPPTNTPAAIPPPPSTGSFSINLEGVAQVDTEINFSVVFTDPGLSINLGFATFAWGDGHTSTCPPDDTTACWIDLGVGSVDQVTSSSTFTVGEVKGRHVYSEPGVYTVQLTLRDEFGQFDTATTHVAVYDVLDDFNRPNGPIGGNWRGAKSRYRIRDEELRARFLGGALYWRSNTYGPNQEASITLSRIARRADQGVLLKVQPWSYWQSGIKVFYDSGAGEVGVDTIVPGVGETILATWPMTLSAGDRLGGRALADGTVEVYVNAVLIGTVDAGSFFVDEGGAIGLWSRSLLRPYPIMDDFSGGNLP
jgi:hypothetical protein